MSEVEGVRAVDAESFENLCGALRSLIAYGRGHISDGLPHNPTLPSAIASAEQALIDVGAGGRREKGQTISPAEIIIASVEPRLEAGILVKTIEAYGKQGLLACDGNCRKAWGIEARPRDTLGTDDPDDYAFLADGELGIAPDDPGTYEGGTAKPDPDGDRFRQNRWCLRQCERSTFLEPGEMTDVHSQIPDFTARRFNLRDRCPTGT